MKRLQDMIEKAYALSAQVLTGDEADSTLAEELCSECAELLAHINGDKGAFESEEIMDSELVELAEKINRM
jgi:hypothetical protein